MQATLFKKDFRKILNFFLQNGILGYRGCNFMEYMQKIKSTFDLIIDLLLRFRFPCTLPSEIAESLGVDLPRYPTFSQLIQNISSCNPTKLHKFMSREEAENAFFTAQRKERFVGNSLYSYYFNEGWIEFVLQFDDNARLRRLYLHHKSIKEDEGIEIPLS